MRDLFVGVTCFVVFPALASCTREISPASADDPTVPAAGEPARTESKDAGGGRGTEGGALVCRDSAACTLAADCVAALDGVAGCWTCAGGCCTAVALGQDPSGVCPKSACVASACNGQGGCVSNTRGDGVPCGNVCVLGEGYSAIEKAVCQAGSCVRDTAPDTIVQTCGTTPKCTGNANGCAKCPATGCSATCSAAASSPSCP